MTPPRALTPRTLLPVVLLTACGTTTPPGAAPAASSTSPLDPGPVASSAPVVAKSGEALCAAFAGTQKEALTRALTPGKPPVDDEPMDEGTIKETLTPLATFCRPTKKGAWATLLESTSERPWSMMGGFQAKWSLVHLGSDGSQTKTAPTGGAVAEPWNFAASQTDPSTFNPPTVFDFDGDGEEEIGLVLDGHIHEGESWVVAHLWTFREGALKRYTPSESIDFDAIEDVDKDGRPDLVGFAKYDASYENCCSGFPWRVTGPNLLAHSAKDGSFTYADEVAIAFAKASCEKATQPVATKGKPWEEADLLLSVACARIQGRSAADVKAELDKAVPLSKAKESCDNQTCKDPNTLRAIADAWADLPPPLQFSKK